MNLVPAMGCNGAVGTVKLLPVPYTALPTTKRKFDIKPLNWLLVGLVPDPILQ
jgi:hypothetical protein